MQKRESALSFILAAEDEEPLKSLLMEISNRPFSKIQNGDKRKVKLSFYRWLRGEFKVYSTIKGNTRTEKFISLWLGSKENE